MSASLLLGAVILALLWTGGATPGVLALVGLGAAMIVAVCVISEC